MCWKYYSINTWSNITDRKYECRSLKNSQYKIPTEAYQETKKTLIKIHKSQSFDKNSSTD